MSETYNYRVVGFVDILGFGNLVRRADRDPGLREQIVEALGRVRQVSSPTEGETDLRAQNFSDSLILSAADTPEGLWHLLLSIDALAWNLLQLGVLIRGGVTIGGMRHEPEVVFGVGVNEAYRLESTVAKMPRIVLGAPAFDAAERYAREHEVWATYRNARLLRDRDGVWFLNYLTELGSFNRQSPTERDMLHHPLCKMGRSIQAIFQSKLDRTLDQPDVYAKIEMVCALLERGGCHPSRSHCGSGDRSIEPRRDGGAWRSVAVSKLLMLTCTSQVLVERLSDVCQDSAHRRTIGGAFRLDGRAAVGLAVPCASRGKM